MKKIILKNRLEIPDIDERLDNFIYQSLTITNPKWLSNKRMGRWNGDTQKKLFYYWGSGTKLFVPRGFVSSIENFCEENNIDIEIEDETRISKENKFKFHGKLKDFQIKATKDILKFQEGVLSSPTGSGKTVMGLYCIAQRKQPTIILVHTKELLYQWIERIETFLNISKKKIGIIGSGFCTPKEITVSLVQSLKKRLNVLNNFTYVMIDECHKTPAKTFTDILFNFDGAYLTGLSATPYRSDGLGKLIEWYIGPIRHKISPKVLIEGNHITGLEPIIRNTFFKSNLVDPSSNYSKLLNEISNDELRNQMIVKDIISEVIDGNVCLVLSDRKAHCNTIKSLIPAKYKSVVLTGDTGSDERKKIVDGVNKGKIEILIATGQLIGEGFDCKNLSTLFLTMPIKYVGRIFQYIGRVLRLKKGKDKARIYDYFDPNIKCLYGGLKEREKVYNELS